MPVRTNPLELGAKGAVAMARDVHDVLEEVVRLDAREELVRGQEPVLAPLLLARPTVARRRGDRYLEVRNALQQLADQRSLPGTRRPGDDDERRPVATG